MLIGGFSREILSISGFMAAYADTATAALPRSYSMRVLLLLALPALASARFSVTAGGDDCAVTDGGDCVTSSGYSRGGYSENEGCTITMDPPARSWACFKPSIKSRRARRARAGSDAPR